MKLAVKITPGLIVLFALFAATLCFPSAREAHVLCIRLLLHLKGDTLVQGQPPGCIIYTIPNVQFTPSRAKSIRDHAKDSIDAYALAAATGDYARVESPMADSSWTNHPLLEWTALRLAWLSERQHETTNAPGPNLYRITSASARRALHLAQAMNPTNGALWLAEACLDFDEGRDADALQRLKIAATNTTWSANSSVSFSTLANLYHAAGLSELDAVTQAKWVGTDTSVLALQGSCSRHLDRLMIHAITNGLDAEFLRLLEIMTSLRRAEWEDQDFQIRNTISMNRSGSDDLINAMAFKLGRQPLPSFTEDSYAQRRALSRQIFKDFFDQLSDQRLAAIYQTQSEGFLTERRLRRAMSHREFRDVWWMLPASLAGALAPLLLTLVVVVLALGLAAWKLLPTELNFRVVLRQRKILLGLFLEILGFALLISNYFISMGMNSEVGFGPTESTPVIHPGFRILLLLLVIPVVVTVVYFLANRISKPAKLKPGELTMATLGAYLILILLMACFRHQLVTIIALPFT